MIDNLVATAIAAREVAPPPGSGHYPAYCDALAVRLDKHWDRVRAANETDVAAARARGLPEVLVDRLALTDRHREQLMALAGAVAAGLPAATAAGDPRPAGGGGMTIRRIPKPLGLLLMIYEARPTVTLEGALLPVGVGNAVVLRGGSEIASTAGALGELATDALRAAALPAGMVQVITDPDRRLVRELLRRADAFDALIPRGSPSLIDYCQQKSTIPVIASGGGVNHLYVDRTADLDLAARIALDSKLAEPTACNTLELVLAHEEVAGELARRMRELGEAAEPPYELRLAPELLPASTGGSGRVRVVPLAPDDAGREFLDRTVGLLPVAGVEPAIDHIRRYGSRHTEGVVAADRRVVDRFLRAVDAAALVVNGSLRLHDGQTMGLGPELSISTGRLQVRGPVDLSALLTYSWVIDGDGALRGTGEEAQ